jgi:hypothetical protein
MFVFKDTMDGMTAARTHDWRRFYHDNLFCLYGVIQIDAERAFHKGEVETFHFPDVLGNYQWMEEMFQTGCHTREMPDWEFGPTHRTPFKFLRTENYGYYLKNFMPDKPTTYCEAVLGEKAALWPPAIPAQNLYTDPPPTDRLARRPLYRPSCVPRNEDGMLELADELLKF